MALTKNKKELIISQVGELIDKSKLTVAAKYAGTSVQALESLRKEAKKDGTIVKVVKNRLVIKALNNNPKFKDIDLSLFKDMLIYAFNENDELGSAQTLANFAKSNTNIEFIAGLTNKGELLNSDDVKVLASLPSKEQLRSILVGTLIAPLSGFASVLNANITSLLYVLKARENNIS